MIRDISEPLSQELYQPEPPLEFLDIPRPTFECSGLVEDEVDSSSLCYIPSLADHCVKVLSESLSIDNALDLLENADHNQLDELKINCLKFISLNIVSFLEGNHLQRFCMLPVYLVRELENFLKADVIGKFGFFNMR